jgi:flagellar assembly factor FliW
MHFDDSGNSASTFSYSWSGSSLHATVTGVHALLKEMHSVETKYFGTRPYAEESAFEFPISLPTFEAEKAFVLVKTAESVVVLALISLDDEFESTANLMAPLALNVKTRRGAGMLVLRRRAGERSVPWS